MPLHDYKCPSCNAVQVDVYRSIEQGASANPPTCPCGAAMEWQPAIGCMDAFEPGGEFVCYDGQNRPVLVESFKQMHDLERSSEQQFRNGEGQPIRFRALHQHRNNREVNTFGPDPSEHPTKEAAERFGGPMRAIEATEGPPDIPYGPGVNDTNASALKDAPG